jgi:hypothetical protein
MDASGPVAGERAALALLLSLATAPAGCESTYASWKRGLRDAVRRDPFDVTIVTVVGGAFLFYLAERGHNPKVRTYWDALVFISTCLSVGYADIFARTPAGQAIASAVMTFGPAMSGAIFDEPAHGAEEDDPWPKILAVQNVIVEKLDAILGELREGTGRNPHANR